jgi:hypothetical protein
MLNTANLSPAVVSSLICGLAAAGCTDKDTYLQCHGDISVLYKDSAQDPATVMDQEVAAHIKERGIIGVLRDDLGPARKTIALSGSQYIGFYNFPLPICPPTTGGTSADELYFDTAPCQGANAFPNVPREYGTYNPILATLQLSNDSKSTLVQGTFKCAPVPLRR